MTVTGSPRAARTVGEIIDARAVTTLFQPLVDLERREPVGYEALSRGPAGTPWQAPIALFEAAREIGRAAELDWICRVRAYEAALAAGLDDSMTLFVNIEPMALRTPCPDDLFPATLAAQGKLRVVTEITERAIAGDPSALLSTAAACRAVGWGVAFDDVGSDPASLALMPLVRPDVVKLDMGLLHDPHRVEVAHVVNAAIAYAERTGAVILAEGIETEEHLELARTMGATLGQGLLFGPPAPLPVPAVTCGTSVPLLPADGVPPVAVPPRTPFEIVAAAKPVLRTTKERLAPISRFLESKARDDGEPPVLLACFQEARFFTPSVAQRFADTATTAAFVAVLGVGLDERPAAGVRGARLSEDDPLRGEWNVIVVGPYFAAALTARDLGLNGMTEAERRFEYALTHDRELVLEAARALMHWISPV
ncbi:MULTISPECIES: sensor domain-containing phosphodiesterase [Catenuloplanes]|uniref:EAL domain-containing protein (Putative c-di-GMP-specific phosphodiesterase class I) n=1 Tax=Catenuloplanes niger TaxID=587534 RepID=A0AAE3ZS77_9ACTN|nr:EAL domain-containing protein [Catenuloplanes niger]MDR7325113.1 EAL domain-containing protein (putative c-di-GMP-specific phosphodiesterase class I) [Catenuloplanes niger]